MDRIYRIYPQITQINADENLFNSVFSVASAVKREKMKTQRAPEYTEQNKKIIFHLR